MSTLTQSSPPAHHPPQVPTPGHADLLALAQPHRLSALSPLVSLTRAALTCALAYLDVKHLPSPLTTPLVVALVALVCGEVVVSTLRYWRTRWGVSDGRFWINTIGLLRREQLSIELTALQSVDLRRPFLARILGLSQLSLSPSAGHPIRVSYVAHSSALALSRTLTALAPLLPERDTPATGTERASTRRLLVAAALATITELVAVVSVIVGVSLVVITTALALVVLIQFPELLTSTEPAGGVSTPGLVESPAPPPEDAASRATPAAHTSLAAALIALGVLTLRHAFSRWRYYVERGWHFTLTRSSDPATGELLLHTQAGLFDAQQDSLPAARIQELTLIQHPSWRPFGWRELVAHTSANERITLMPPAPVAAATSLAGELFDQLPPLLEVLAPAPRRGALLRPWGRTRALALGPELLALTSGALVRRTRALRLERIQGVVLSTSPIMSLLGLTRVEIELAGRTRASTLLTHAGAAALADALLPHARGHRTLISSECAHA